MRLLKGSGIKIITVAGFPLGANSTTIKCKEAEFAFAEGADEVDVVMNIGWMKDKNTASIKNEFSALVKSASSKPIKIILETCLLSDEEKVMACQLAVECGVPFVKTSSGFSHGGATVEDVRLMKSIVAGKAKVKASAGIRDIQAAMLMIAAGADRLGTSSGVTIMQNAGKEYIDELSTF